MRLHRQERALSGCTRVLLVPAASPLQLDSKGARQIRGPAQRRAQLEHALLPTELGAAGTRLRAPGWELAFARHRVCLMHVGSRRVPSTPASSHLKWCGLYRNRPEVLLQRQAAYSEGSTGLAWRCSTNNWGGKKIGKSPIFLVLSISLSSTGSAARAVCEHRIRKETSSDLPWAQGQERGHCAAVM